METVPTEILASIFLSAVIAEDQSEYWCDDDLGRLTIRPERSRAPLLLTEVCKRWNDVASTSPALWTCIAFDMTLVKSYWQATQLQTWLSRSRLMLLDLDLRYPDHLDPYQSHTEYQFNFYNVALRHSHRWRSAIIDLAAFLESGNHPVMPQLRRLIVKDKTDHEPHELPPLYSFIPNVVNLSLRDVSGGRVLRDTEARVLRDLSAFSMVMQSLSGDDLDVVRFMPQLRVLFLDLVGLNNHGAENPFVLQQLRKLHPAILEQLH